MCILERLRGGGQTSGRLLSHPGRIWRYWVKGVAEELETNV